MTDIDFRALAITLGGAIGNFLAEVEQKFPHLDAEKKRALVVSDIQTRALPTFPIELAKEIKHPLVFLQALDDLVKAFTKLISAFKE